MNLGFLVVVSEFVITYITLKLECQYLILSGGGVIWFESSNSSVHHQMLKIMGFSKTKLETILKKQVCNLRKLTVCAGKFNFNFEVVAPNGYAAAMSRKTPDSHNGFNDVIGVALLAAALLLLVAQFSFDRNDISFLTTQANAFRAQLDQNARRVSGVGFVFAFRNRRLHFAVAARAVRRRASAEFFGLPARASALVGVVVGCFVDFAHRPALPRGQRRIARKIS